MEASQPAPQHPQKPAVAALAPEEPAAAAAVCGKAAAVGDAEPGAGATAVASHHLKKRPEMARVDSVGLVSYDSLNEEEVRSFFCWCCHRCWGPLTCVLGCCDAAGWQQRLHSVCHFLAVIVDERVLSHVA